MLHELSKICETHHYALLQGITLASMMRAFRALGVQVALEMKGIGKVAL